MHKCREVNATNITMREIDICTKCRVLGMIGMSYRKKTTCEIVKKPMTEPCYRENYGY